MYKTGKKYLMGRVECEIVDGYGKTVDYNVEELGIPNHSWTAVSLNKKWYLADATWSSGSFDLQANKFIKDYDDGYFLAEPQLFALDHYPLDSTWLLSTEKFTKDDFVQVVF